MGSRGPGYLFGPRSRWWAIVIVAATAVAATGLGVAAVAAGHHMRAPYVGVIAPGVLWLHGVAARRSRQHRGLVPRRVAACFEFPFQRLASRMGDDLTNWCDERERAVSGQPPESVTGAATYYCNQVLVRLKDRRAVAEMASWRDSIRHKIRIVRLIELDTTPARVDAELHAHQATRDIEVYQTRDLAYLADRLRADAENELHLMLASAYRHGYRKLLVYPFRPPRERQQRRPRRMRGLDPPAGKVPLHG
jgi:hypothetical protein